MSARAKTIRANKPVVGKLPDGQSYAAWIVELKRRYRATQIKAAVAVNSALIELALPLNRDDLIHPRRVEGARIEYKKDGNPERVLHSVCAFANEIDNWGGHWEVIGKA